jgi:hypothetical protein
MAARDEGKLTDGELPAWRQQYQRDPAATEAMLARMVGVPFLAGQRAQETAAATRKAEHDRLLVASRTRMGHAAAGLMPVDRPTDPAPPPTPLAPVPRADWQITPAVPAVRTTSLGVDVDASGRMSYKGCPVSIAEDGTPRVEVSTGEMTIATAESLGVNFGQEAVLYASRARMGFGPRGPGNAA